MRFLQELFPEPCMVRVKTSNPEGGVWSSWLEKTPPFDEFWRLLDTRPQDVYFGVTARNEEGVPVWAGAAWVDLDGSDEISFVLPPSWVVYSGYGVHGYWLFKEPQEVRVACAISRSLGSALGGDAVGDAERVLRLPGSFNLKRAGMVPVFARRVSSARYDADDFPFDWSVQLGVESSGDLFCGALSLVHNAPAASRALIAAWRPGYRHYLALYLSAFMAKLGYSLEAIETLFRGTCAGAGDEEESKRLLTARQTFDKVKSGVPVEGMAGLNRLIREQVPADARVGLFLFLGDLRRRAEEEIRDVSL